MARLRKFVAYRSLERPYTRISKYNKKSYIKSRPHMVLVKFNMGDLKKKFPVRLQLKTKTDLQIRQNAIESAISFFAASSLATLTLLVPFSQFPPKLRHL